MSFTVPPLHSGGVMLTYKCDNACRHCLYCCSPKSSDEVMSEEMIDHTMSALSKERSLDGIHFGGGECSLFFDWLLYAIRSAVKHGVRIDYLETNGGWCIDDQTAVDGFKRLRDAGLSGVLISASLFHLEFIPVNVTKTAIRAAHKVFDGAFVWTDEVLRLMERLPDHDKKYPIQESCRLLGINPADGTLWQIHSYLNPCGRAARRLSEGLRRYAALICALRQLGSAPAKGDTIKIGQALRDKKCSGLGVGNCCSGCDRYVPGCPPTAAQILEMLR